MGWSDIFKYWGLAMEAVEKADQPVGNAGREKGLDPGVVFAKPGPG